MGINGQSYELTEAEGHPKAFVKALYEEFFDLHPADSTVDLAIAVRDTTTDSDRTSGERATFEVIDARIMRVTDPAWDNHDGPLTASMHRYLDPAGQGEEGPFGLLREMVRWATSLDGKLIWVQKNPEGDVRLTEQDVAWSEGLRAIDFATGNGKTKQYRLGVLVNRETSVPIPMAPGVPQPSTGFADIDLEITEKVTSRPITKYGLDENHPYTIAQKQHMAAARVIFGHEDEHGQPHHEAAHKQYIETTKVMGREAASIALADPRASEADKRDAQTLLSTIQLMDLMEGAAKQATQPQAIPLPRDILSLPQFQLPASDNAKPRIGFRSPDERDRLN